MVVKDALLTLEALMELPQESGYLYELDRGTLIIMNPPKHDHGLVTGELAYQITAFVRAHNLGTVLAAETGFLLARDPDVVRGADIAFIARDRRVEFVRGYATSLDLAVEVVSPGNDASDLNRKVEQYFTAGARQVWLVYIETRRVYVYASPTAITVIGVGETIDGGDVLRGFTVGVDEIFAVLPS